jgi:hypothetical protein
MMQVPRKLNFIVFIFSGSPVGIHFNEKSVVVVRCWREEIRRSLGYVQKPQPVSRSTAIQFGGILDHAVMRD